MYKGLYDQFAHWFHEGRGAVWFYSDPHFGDEEMKALRKDYIGDEEQIKRINSKVGKYDTLVILGDVGDVECVKKLRGYKVLIMGNHDKGASNYKRKFETIYEEETLREKRSIVIDNKLFNEVYEGPLYISEKILLSHEPLRSVDTALNICGHDHAGWYTNDAYGEPHPYYWNMCAELINYTPVSLKDIITSGRLKKIDSIHREAIDRAIMRKQDREKKRNEIKNLLDEFERFEIS